MRRSRASPFRGHRAPRNVDRRSPPYRGRRRRPSGEPAARRRRQSPRRGDVFRPPATISPCRGISRLRRTPLETMTPPSDPPPARNPWQVASPRPLLPLCGLSGAARGGAGRIVRGRQVALQRPARRRRVRLPDLPQPARQGAGSLALHRSDAAAVGGRRLLLHALPPGFDGGATDGDRLVLARLLPHPLRRDRPARAGADAALRAQPLARRGARGARGRRGRAPPSCSARSSRAPAARR